MCNYKDNENQVSTNLVAVAPNCKGEALAGTCKTDEIYMNAACDKYFCGGMNCYNT